MDAILPLAELPSIEANDDFWEALEKTNQKLDASGLYMTHLFVENQVILSPDWLKNLVEIPIPVFQKLQLFRPSTEDLILTKMMRIDPQDREDIAFLIQQLSSKERLQEALDRAVIPPHEELQRAFDVNREWLQQQFFTL